MTRARASEAAAVDRAIDLAARRWPRAAADARAALDEALAGLHASTWPEVAWRFSRITGDGFPVELTFSSAGGGIRYTAEIGGPEMPTPARVAVASRWAGVHGPFDMGVGTALVAARSGARGSGDQGTKGPGGEGTKGRGDEGATEQGDDIDTPLRWGAWGGGFHDGVANRRKIYLEVTAIHRAATRAAPTIPGLPAGSTLRFVGVTAESDDREYYFRRDNLTIAEVGRLMCGAGLRECASPLLEAIAKMLPWPTHDRLLRADAGFSVVPGRGVSVFTYARRVWGSDASIRRAVLRLAEQQGWHADVYEQVTRPLQSADGYLTHHGILAWIAVPGRPIELRISVRPPPVCP
jgi:hypothetical protein